MFLLVPELGGRGKGTFRTRREVWRNNTGARLGPEEEEEVSFWNGHYERGYSH